MSNTSELMQYISSISLQERLKFENQWAKPGSNYLLLFKWLCEKKTPDTDLIKKRLKKAGIVQPLPQIKKKLKEQLSKFFIYRLLSGEEQVYNNQMEFLLLKALQSRGIMNQVTKRAEKLQANALAMGDYNTALLAFEMKLYEKRDNVPYIMNALPEYNDIVNMYSILSRVKVSIYTLNSFRKQYLFAFNAPINWEQTRPLLPNEIFDNQLAPDNMQLSAMLLNAQWLYYITEYNRQATYVCSDKMRAWVLQHQKQLRQHAATPMMFSFKLMAAIEFADHHMFHQDYEQVLLEMTKWNNSFAEWQNLGEFQIAHLLTSNKLEDLDKLLAERTAYFRRKNLPPHPNEYIYKMLHLLGKDRDAINELHSIINQVYKPQKNLTNESYARVDELMILADMGSVSIIASKVEAYRKWLSRKLPHIDSSSVEYAVTKYFPRLYTAQGKPDNQVFKELLSILEEYAPSEHPLLINFFGGLIPWLQSKLTNRRYHSIVQDRVQNNIDGI